MAARVKWSGLPNLVLCMSAAAVLLSGRNPVLAQNPGSVSSFAASDRSRYIAIASRQNYQEAVSIAWLYARASRIAEVYKASNGWFAVALEPEAIEDARHSLQQLQSLSVLPQDAHLTQGKTYVEEVWRPRNATEFPIPGSALGQALNPASDRNALPRGPLGLRSDTGNPTVDPGRYGSNKDIATRLGAIGEMPDDAILLLFFRDAAGVDLRIDGQPKLSLSKVFLCVHPDIDRVSLVRFLRSKNISPTSVGTN